MKIFGTSDLRWSQVSLLAGLLLVIFLVRPGWAQQDYHWTGAAGPQDWGTATNWNPNGIPGTTANDNALLDSSDNINRIAVYRNTFPTVPTLNGVQIDARSIGTMTLELGVTGPAHTLQTQELSVGHSYQGIFHQRGGSLDVLGYLMVANQQDSAGTFTLEGGNVAANYLFVGHSGEGVFTQSQLTPTPTNVYVTNDLGLGVNANSMGAFGLSSGSINTEHLYVGAAGTGIFTQTGGTHTVRGNINMGNEASGIGQYFLYGGTLAPMNTFVGYYGTGTFFHDGGSHTIGDVLTLGYNAGSTGAYIFDNGTVTANYLEVGEGGSGSFDQTGGSLLLNNHLRLGRNQGSRGEFNYTGGTLRLGDPLNPNIPGYLIIGGAGTGTFNHESGTPTITGDIYIGDEATGRGTYNLTGGSLVATTGNNGALNVGVNGVGVFNQSANTTVTVNRLFVQSRVAGETSVFYQRGDTTVFDYLGIARDANSRGEYNLLGGNLRLGIPSDPQNPGNIYVGHGGTGVFNQNGGVPTINGGIYLGGDATGHGTYNLLTGNLSAAVLDVGYDGVGFFNQSPNTTLTINGSLVVNCVNTATQTGTSIFTQGGGTTTVADYLGVGRDPNSHGRFDLQNGSLTVGDLYVGWQGIGTFNQTGGTHEVLNSIHIATGELGSSGDGTYNLQNTTLLPHSILNTRANVYVGGYGAGVFNHMGGNHNITGNLLLGTENTGRGTYNLGGGQLTVTDIEVGSPGTGIFNQTGGTLNANTINLNGGGIFNRTTGTLNFTTFNHQGGEVQGSLVNPLGGTYNYFNGTFTGRLLNYGIANLFINGNTFTAGNGLAFYSNYTLNPGQTIICSGPGFEVGLNGIYNQTGGTLRPGNQFNVRAGGVFNQSGGIVDGTSNTVFISEGTTNINNATLYSGRVDITGGNFTLGNGSLIQNINNLNVGTGGTFTQNGGIVDGTSNTIISNEGVCNLNGGTLRPGNQFRVGAGGTFTQIGGIVDGTSNTVFINEGTCNLNGGTLSAGTINLQANSVFNRLAAGTLNCGTLNIAAGANYVGNLDTFGTVMGNGTIQGNYVNRGTVNPGNSPGTLNVVGSYTQPASGNYVVEIASATNYDKIVVTGAPGTANVGGTLTPTLLGAYKPAPNQLFPGIVTATGGITGTFNTIPSWKLLYSLNSIDLQYYLPSPTAAVFNFADPSIPLTPNQRNVGMMLNDVRNGATGDLGNVLTTIAQLPSSSIPGAYQQISPEKAHALPAVTLAGSMMQWRSLTNRLNDIRWASGGSSASGGGRAGSLNLSYSRLAGAMLAYNGGDLGGLFSGDRKEKSKDNPWGIYTDYVGNFGSQNSSVNQTGYDFNINGFNSGIDYRFRDNLILGVGTGYYHTATTYKGSGGNGEVNSIPFYLYGTYCPGPFYVMGTLGYTLNLYSMERNINFGGINRKAKSSVDGGQLNASGEMGLDFDLRGVNLNPAVSLFYAQSWVGGFTESGADSLNLQVKSQSATSLQTGVGARLTRPFKAGKKLVIPEVSAFYQHEFSNNSRGLDARLAQSGSNFTFRTDSPQRDYAVLGAGVAVGLKKNLFIRTNYNAEVGRGKYTSHFVSAGLRLEF